VTQQGGFEFKETLMSGDKEKVLGLIWETEADRLRVDVKLNLEAKRAGLHLMDNVELTTSRRSSRRGSCGVWHRASMTHWVCCVPSPFASRC
jgi:hypothetical protein